MKTKIRVLLCNEFSGFSSGYAVYGHNLLSRLYERENLEIAELGCILHDGQTHDKPWRVYPGRPHPSNKQETEKFNSNMTNHHGASRFEQTCLDFKPHVVMDIRDHWMFSYQETSPFRDYYSWLIMPTVDATPQHPEWVATYGNANGVFCYTDWGCSELEKYGHINLLGSAPPAADECFCPMNKDKIRDELGLMQDVKIVGTVMRNQRRKLFPELFATFRKMLFNGQMDKTYLYCHTSYPDGWNIPHLLIEHGLSSKVLFTYVCRNCRHYFADFFRGAFTKCTRCGNHSAGMPMTNFSAQNTELAKIYNCFDVYVQYATNEGFGIPMVEAACCGVPVVAVDYSAMSDVVRKVNGFPIKVLAYTKEPETGRLFAVPDNDHTAQVLLNILTAPREMRARYGGMARTGARQNYSWDKTADKWANAIESLGAHDRWNTKRRVVPIPAFSDRPELSNADYVEWLMTAVLASPRMSNTSLKMRLLNDLDTGTKRERVTEFYTNEHSYLFSKPKLVRCDRQSAFDECAKIRHHHNTWEIKRCEK